MAGYPPFQQPITKSAKEIDNPAWRQFFVRVGQLITGAVTHILGNLANSHLVLGNGGGDIRTLASLGSATTVLHGNAAGDPSFSAVSLTADVSGTLPVANGGTGVATLTANRIPYGNNTSPFQSASNFTFDGTTLTIPGQIAFPATQDASGNANTLDDYEEGNWTPVVGGGGGTSGQTYATQIGRYVKVGLMVNCDFYIKFSNKGTITGGVELQGLPFVIENTSGYFPVISMGYWNALNTAMVWLSGTGVFDGVNGTLYGATAAATGLTQLVTGDLTNTTELAGHISYRATA